MSATLRDPASFSGLGVPAEILRTHGAVSGPCAEAMVRGICERSGAACGLSITGIFVFIGLVPIYIFLLLFYKNLLLRFVFFWFPSDNHEKVESKGQRNSIK